MRRQVAPIFAVCAAVGAHAVAVQAQTTVTVQLLTNNTFSPADVTISVGDTVHWEWVGGNHNVESGPVLSGSGVHDGIFRSGNPTPVSGTTYDLVFDQPFLDANPVQGNVYAYYCEPHTAVGMIGRVTVQVSGGCGNDADCDDGNECTDDVCNTGTCENVANTAACDDGDSCTLDDACSNGGCAGTPDPGCAECTTDADCDDGNACTNDVCNGVVCANTANTAACDDGDACTLSDACSGGVCAGTPDPACNECTIDDDCDDGDVCTDDTCNAGTCESIANGAICEDGDACTVDDTCDAGVCAGSPLDCSDLSDDCNTGECDAATGTCEQVASNEGAACDDGDDCTVDDVCSGGLCAGTLDVDCSACTTDADCDDGDACTNDTCTNQACVNTKIQGCGGSSVGSTTSSSPCGALGLIPFVGMFMGFLGFRSASRKRTR